MRRCVARERSAATLLPSRTSFSTVLMLMSRTSAISAISSPPKYFNSIARALRGIDGRQPLERFVQRQQIHRARIARRGASSSSDIERDARRPLRRAVPPRMVHQDLTHVAVAAMATKCERLSPVRRGLLAIKPQECLVDERRRLQGVAGPLPAQVGGREPVQLAVDDLRHLSERGLVALPPVLQQNRHRNGLADRPFGRECLASYRQEIGGRVGVWAAFCALCQWRRTCRLNQHQQRFARRSTRSPASAALDVAYDEHLRRAHRAGSGRSVRRPERPSRGRARDVAGVRARVLWTTRCAICCTRIRSPIARFPSRAATPATR